MRIKAQAPTIRMQMNHLRIAACWRRKTPSLFCLLVLLTTGSAQYRSPSANTSTSPASSTSPDPANVALGRRLFFDTRLSLDQQLSCSTCHDPAHAFSDARPLSVGVLGRIGKRHTPTLLGRAFGQSQFWDGRAATLEEQVLQPIANPDELGMTVDGVLERLDHDRALSGLTRQSLAGALASYVRSVRSQDSPLDRFLGGRQDGDGFNPLELEGFRLFRDKARCYLCHSGPQLTDEGFHNTGVAWREGKLQDAGRAAITGKTYHQGAFKTPTLREISRRSPYMHDGSLATLEDVVAFYDRGGNPNPYLDENIIPLHLTDAEKSALLAFLKHGLAGTVVEGTAQGSAHPQNKPRSY